MNKLKNETVIYNFLLEQCEKQKSKGDKIGCTTEYIAEEISISRANVSHALNRLYNDGKIYKIKTRPVLFYIEKNNSLEKKTSNESLDNLIGSEASFKKSIEQAKAAIIYPPNGLHTIILGPTGSGKTMFAELIYRFALEKSVLKMNAPFISFNCADYSNNPQLLLSQLFGAKKGAYTGAEKDRTGIVEQAHEGILFLDEVHRLPAEGQEMLFYLIDKGVYTPLGDTGPPQKVNIRLICATTENKDSTLLSTFSRRIPMVIELPALKDRTLNERFELINKFFNNEAQRIGKTISITAEAIKGLLLYNCINNVGQLKNDVQLGCATAFLNGMTSVKKTLEVDISHFNGVVRRGILNYRQYKNEVEKIIGNSIKFTYFQKGIKRTVEEKNLVPTSFYEEIERRVSELKKRNIEDEDIKLIMSIDTERLIKKYIYKLNNGVRKEELSKILDSKIIEDTEYFLNFASFKLNRFYSQKIFCGLCLHLSTALERISQRKPIINHKLQSIIENYSEEYAIAFHFAGKIEEDYRVKVPLDEVGYLTMFLIDDYTENEKIINEPVILIAMHGNGAARYMAEVVNTLTGADNVYAYDMPLNKSVKEACKEIKEYIEGIHRGGGILLLSDMGSLSLVGDIISQETGIKIRSIEMVTTQLAIECSHQATKYGDLDRIWEEISNNNESVSYNHSNFLKDYDANKNNVIITMCMTGEGSAIKLKNIIEKNVELKGSETQILSMEISNRKDMIQKINNIKLAKNVVCIVGTINPKIENIPFISISEIFIDKNFKRIENLLNGMTCHKKKVDNVNKKEIYWKVTKAFKEKKIIFDVNIYRALVLDMIDVLEQKFNMDIHYDIGIGLICHIGSSIERLIKGIYCEEFKLKDSMNLNIEHYKIIEESLKSIEKVFNIKFPEDEIYIIAYFLLSPDEEGAVDKFV